MEIVSVDGEFLSPENIQALKANYTSYPNMPKNEVETINRIKNADIVIVSFLTPITKNIIDSCNNLKMIALTTTGYDHIDLAAAKNKNIIVCNVCYATQAVAEHTVGLMIEASRLTLKAYQDYSEGIFNPYQYKGKELLDKTLGIIGYGRIG